MLPPLPEAARHAGARRRLYSGQEVGLVTAESHIRDHNANATGRHPLPQGRDELRPVTHSLGRDARGSGEGDQVEAMGGAEEALEVPCMLGSALLQLVEDPPAVVVHDDDDEIRSRLTGTAQQPVVVVQERKVAHERQAGPTPLGLVRQCCPPSRRHQSVDPIGAPVPDNAHPRTGTSERFKVTD